MSVLLVPARLSLGTRPYVDAIVERLLGQDDQVRIVIDERDIALQEDFRAAGAHVAPGSASDHDLIERAGQGARTLVYVDLDGRYEAEQLEAVLTGAGFASIGRLVLCGAARSHSVAGTIGESALPHVVLWIGRRHRFARNPVSPEQLASAVDAADDLAGDPRLELQLREPEAWAALRLSPPRGLASR